MELFFSLQAPWLSPSQCPSPSLCLCPPLTPGVTLEEELCPPPRLLLSTVSMTTEEETGERSADTERGETEVAAEIDTAGEDGHVTDPGAETGVPGGGEREAGVGAGVGTRTGTSGSGGGSRVLGGGGQSPRGARRTGGWPPAVTRS